MVSFSELSVKNAGGIADFSRIPFKTPSLTGKYFTTFCVSLYLFSQKHPVFIRIPQKHDISGASFSFLDYFTFTFILTVLALPFFNVTFALTTADPAFLPFTTPFFVTDATDFFETLY